jgi:hypothetical protein
MRMSELLRGPALIFVSSTQDRLAAQLTNQEEQEMSVYEMSRAGAAMRARS